MENRKRNVQIIVRVTEDERTLIEEKMRQIPTMNLSAYSRKMLIDGYIIVLDLQKVKAHMAQLQKIGGNLNLILSILVDTFISKISFPMQPGPEIGSISDA